MHDCNFYRPISLLRRLSQVTADADLSEFVHFVHSRVPRPPALNLGGWEILTIPRQCQPMYILALGCSICLDLLYLGGTLPQGFPVDPGNDVANEFGLKFQFLFP